jgi:hypothetical protein
MDNIEMNPKGTWYEGMNWIYLTQDRVQRRAVVITVMNRRDV